MSKTIEERIADAEREVERCEDEVADAESALEEAEAELEALEEERDAPERAADEARAAALVAERTGPQRPIGDRMVRQLCALGEIPQRYAAMMSDGLLRGLYSANGDKWASNGHWMIRVDSIDGLAIVATPAGDVIGATGSPITRDDAPILIGSFYARTFGSIFAMLEYTTLVEDLFPGVEWHARSGSLQPIQALVNGQVVAVVMPMRAAA